MGTKKNRKRGQRRGFAIGLNLILWFSFLLFAIILIVLFTVVQSFQINRQYREREESNLLEAGTFLKGIFMSGEFESDELSRVLLSVANQYSVSAYLFSVGGYYIYPEIPSSQNSEYREIYEMVKEQFEQIDQSAKDNAQIMFSSDSFAGYASLVTFGNETCYLYLSSSFEHLNTMMKDGVWVSLVTALIGAALSFVVSGFVSMVITKPVTDVTERAKELARGNYDTRFDGRYFCTELNDLSKALDYAGSEISKTDKMQKELIANVSHDFKTPLTMIKAYASMIQEIWGDDPVKRQQHTQIIIDETDRLAALVGDVLDLSKLQAGIETLEKTVFNLSEDVYGVVSRFGYLVEMNGFTINTEIEEDLYTYASRARADQVLYNLIGNAINYTGEDKTVTIRLKKRAGCARFEVLDTGKGIPPEEIDTIWERYYRSSEMHKRPIKGTGLGLSIVKNVLKRHGIPFGVESEVGKGSCFWVDFPDPPEVLPSPDEKPEKQ